ncbi:MAG: CehA/McbA family metallohydrolase [Gemmatimonadaceae bacterium]
MTELLECHPAAASACGMIAGLALLLASPLPAQQREPVLKQVRVPHPYYWREMYVPQVTSGPSAVTWSPDGREVVYSMQGSLWRQRLGTPGARQLTAGPTYDYQPDWSPDGRFVAYASYDGEAISLKLLDVASGQTRTLVADGAVNVEPRWSPDGSRLAFVSTTFNGRWHVFVGRFDATRGLGDLRRVTVDRNSGLPRYYYSVFDHYLSPTWSPDGRELIFVSNRGRVYGTGGIWRASLGDTLADARELHYEETTWKARPDWSRDGKRVVYSGYHGRQWNQLWLLSADGGDPIQLTYGEFDATAPRWSPDGRRIAYISNEGGNSSLWVVDVPGGRRTRVTADDRQYVSPTALIALDVRDAATGRPVPARVSVRRADGRYFAPDDAWRHADEAFVRGGDHRFEYGYFHTRGRDTVVVPAGRVAVEVWRGPEYRVTRREVDVGEDEILPLRLSLTRLTDMAARGWWGGDLHVHMNYGGAYRNTPAQLALQGRAEGLHVLENLIVNKEQRIPDIAYWRPDPDPVSTDGFLLAHGQEFHTGFWGHTGLVGLREHYLLPDYAAYPRTALASLYPTNAVVADLARAQGALMGYVHPFDSRPDTSRVEGGVPYELPIDAAVGKLDYLEVMGYSDHLITSEVWYRLLNCGFRVPAGAGTDAFPSFASLRGPPGLVRVYARVESGGRRAVLAPSSGSHRRFLDAIKAGRTFVTNAPLLDFQITGPDDVTRQSGDEIRLPAGRQQLRVRAILRSNVPVDHLELVGNGRVIASLSLTSNGTSADTTVVVPVEESGWYVLRAWSDWPRLPVLDLYPFATTSPIYVEVAGAPIRTRSDADYFLAWIARVDEAVRAHTAWNTTAERDEAMRTIAAARAEFERRRR